MAVGSHGGVEIQGLKELGVAFRALPARLASNVGRGATAAATSTIRNEARDRARAYVGQVQRGHPPPGTMRRSIITKFVREKSTALFFLYIVHVRSGKQFRSQGKGGKLSQDAFYWPFVEFGTHKMTAHPFLRPAFEIKKVPATAAFDLYLRTRLPIEVEKLKVFGLSIR